MLYKRSTKAGAPYWTRFTIRKREVRVSCGTSSKKLAEEFERRLREQIWRETELGEVRYTWEEAKERWLREKARRRAIKRDKDSFDILDPLLTGLALCDIDQDKVDDCQKKLSEGRKPSTVFRLMAPLRAVLRKALKKWKWLTAIPTFESQPRQLPTPRWATEEQFDILWRELPDHAKQIIRFAVAVGQRWSNISRLRWRAVDMARKVFWVESDEFKGERDVGFPLPPDAMEVLRQQRGRHPEYVFTDHLGRAPVGSIKTCWRKARKRAGLPWLRVHDMRHTWAAWHKLVGTPPQAIQELGGWADPRMVERYGHINAQDYAHVADNRRTNNGTSGSDNSGK